MKPNRAKKATVTAPEAALNRGSAKSVTSSIGCSARRSRRTNSATSASAPAKPASVAALDQPRSGPSMIVWVSRPSAATDTARPGRSSRGTDGSRDSGTKARVIAVATSATGTSAQNTECQLKCSSSQPPLTGPRATPRPVLAPQAPRAAARSRRSVKVLAMIDSVVGKIRAAHTPIAKRSATSWPAVEARAATPVAVANPSRPSTSAGRRPNRSDRLPIASTRAANARL